MQWRAESRIKTVEKGREWATCREGASRLKLPTSTVSTFRFDANAVFTRPWWLDKPCKRRRILLPVPILFPEMTLLSHFCPARRRKIPIFGWQRLTFYDLSLAFDRCTEAHAEEVGFFTSLLQLLIGDGITVTAERGSTQCDISG